MTFRKKSLVIIWLNKEKSYLVRENIGSSLFIGGRLVPIGDSLPTEFLFEILACFVCPR